MAPRIPAKMPYEPTKPELFRMIARHVRAGELDIAWMQLRVLRRRVSEQRRRVQKRFVRAA